MGRGLNPAPQEHITTMPIDEEFRAWPGHDAFAPHGQRIGIIDRVFTDRKTDAPSFAVVMLGPLNDVPKLVPTDGAWLHEDHVHVAYSVEAVESAPDVETRDELTGETERRVREHFGILPGDLDAEVEVVEREVLIREPTGQQTVERDSIVTPIAREPS